MRKSYFLVPLAVLVVGGAYAMTGLLFPDTPGFPRIPTGEGTVGGMIARVLGVSDLLTYSDDGSVKNTAMLSGVTASGYLMRSDICPSGQYWTGIGADGKSTCGSTTILLADMGTITEVRNGMTIYRADGAVITPVSVPTTVKSGDIIKTDGTGTGTITFSDLSVLRLDTDTTVSMDQTTSGTGVTVASALLANGSIWGRILTDTGVYNIGSSDIVAAVRGTSIVVMQTGATTTIATGITGRYEITKTGTQGKTQLAILDSALGTGSITTVNCTQTTTQSIPAGAPVNGYTPGSQESQVNIEKTEVITTSTATGSITPEKMYRVSPGDCTGGSSLTGSTPASLYTMSPWIQNNTKKDIIYMVNLSLSGAITDSTKTIKIVKELNQTTPKDSTECANLLGTGSDCTDIVDKKVAEADSIDNPEAPIMTGCKIRKQKYWSLYKGEKNMDKKCQEPGIIAIADYTTGKPDLYFSGGIKSLMPMDQNYKGSISLVDDFGIWNHTVYGATESHKTDSSITIPRSSSLFAQFPNNNRLFALDDQYAYSTIPDSDYQKIKSIMQGYPMAYIGGNGSRTLQDGWDTGYYQDFTFLKPQDSSLVGQIFNTAAGSLNGGGGANIANTGQYISYPSVLIPGGLAGKTIRIELTNAAGSSLNGSWTKAYVVDFGTEQYFITNNTKCISTDTNGNYLCKRDSSGNQSNLGVSGNTITIQSPSTLTSFMIGNFYSYKSGAGYGYWNPIGTTIKKITIL